jgi:glycosyltransferase involved in cell wall biosynthesis
MRVCFLTHYFPPEVGAPQTRIELVARSLAVRGIEVTVHTGFPHYPAGGVGPPYRNRPWRRERRDGVQVIRSAVYPAANRGFVRRLADHTAFALSALATAGVSGPAEVVIGETPPLFVGAAGVLYARRKRAAYVLNVADLWPESAVELGALNNPWAIAAATRLERWTYAHADLITTPTEGIVERLGVRPETEGKLRRLQPVVDLERFDPTPAQSTEPSRPLELLYAGTIGLAQGLEVLVEASHLAGPEVVHATIVGDGADAPAVRARVRALGLENVTMLGTVPAARIPDLYAQADAAVVLLRDRSLFEGALPTKMFEAMAAGRPLLLAARGEAAELVRGGRARRGGGAPALQADPARRQDLGRQGRLYVESRFGTERAAAAWAQALSDVAAARSGAGPAAR